MDNWTRKTIGDLCDIGGGEVKTGPFGSQLHQSDYSEEGTPVVMPADIINSGISERRIVRVSEKHVSRLAKHKLSFGDIVYGRRGDIGRQALVRNYSEGWLCGTGCLRVTLGNSEVIPEYLHLYLKMPEIIAWIQNQAIGATMPNLNTQILRRIPISYPTSKVDQKKIVSMVFAYDDLIENNKRRIALLENMAEDIYREWFVRFRFPGYQTAKFEKGIPRGWAEGVIGDIYNVQSGYAFKSGDLNNFGELRIIKIGNIGENGVDLESGQFFTGNLDNKVKKFELFDGDFIVAMTGAQIGKNGIIVSLNKRYFLNQRVGKFFVKNKSKLNSMFIYQFAKTNYFRESIESHAHGAAQPNISGSQIEKIKMIIPNESILFKYSEFMTPFLEKISQLKSIEKNLNETKNMLLPRLISGKLSVENLNIQFPPSMQTTAEAE